MEEGEGGGSSGGGGLLLGFLSLLVGDVDEEKEALEEEERRLLARSEAEKEKARKLEAIRKAIEKGVEIEVEGKRAALLNP